MPKKRVYKIAHFSDLHISDDDGVSEALDGIEHALDKGANHVVIAGDITDCADITLTREFLKGIARMGLNSPKKLSLVPGNHDV